MAEQLGSFDVTRCLEHVGCVVLSLRVLALSLRLDVHLGDEQARELARMLVAAAALPQGCVTRRQG